VVIESIALLKLRWQGGKKVAGCDSPNVRGAKFVLTAGESLMYYPQVGISFLLFGKYGRLLKLVDRTDLGSVGDEP